MRRAAGPPSTPIRVGTEIQRRIGVKTSRDEPLARFTTMRVGGPADLYAAAHNVFELRALVKFARARGIPYTLLGRGSDVVISDAGVRGPPGPRPGRGPRDRRRPPRRRGRPADGEGGHVTAEAGLAGLEFGLAIPGNVGGAVWANAGAHASDVAAVLETALVLQADGSEARLDRGRPGPGLPREPPQAPGRRAPRRRSCSPPPSASRRRSRPRSAPASTRSGAGGASTSRSGSRAPGASSGTRPGTAPPGALIDACGLKGLRLGGAVVSERHANWILNDQGGTAADVRRLGERVRATVERETGIRLAFEVVFMGDWAGWVEEAA